MIKIFKLLSDESRLRILMLLTERELCVCQLMGVLGISQPLVSRNLSLLSSAKLLEERRDGKLIFYSIKKNLPKATRELIDLLKGELKNNKTFKDDRSSLSECYEFQKKTGKCDMKTFLAYMEKKRKQRPKEAKNVVKF
ncbi:MAG: metalloregulator ArsR/SmtB family transcription factor [Thermodesulfovibrionales bacterium]|nr:metalloregulator ArsR/SmtB family transcription factor [Thermodesulfovibrionales bacterium]